MLKNFTLLTFIFSLFFIGCDGQNKKIKKTEGGLEYTIFTDADGQNADTGDVMIVHLSYNNTVDSLNTWKHGTPLNALLDTALIFPGSLEEGLLKLSAGDSAMFMVNNYILYNKTFGASVPPKLDSAGTTTFYVKVDTIYRAEEVRKQQMTALQQDMAIVEAYKSELLDSAWVKQALQKDEKQIKQYIRKKDLNATRTENGVYVAVIDSGKGEAAGPGSRLTVEYVGKLLSDSVFQRSAQLQKPFQYVMGAGQAMLGWDEGIVGLKEGAKALIIIPSPLAYGKQGYKTMQGEYLIPPNTPLVFEVTLMDVGKI